MSKAQDQSNQCQRELAAEEQQLKAANDAYNKQVAYEKAHPIKAFFSSFVYPDSDDLARTAQREASDVYNKKLACGIDAVMADPGKALKRMIRGRD